MYVIILKLELCWRILIIVIVTFRDPVWEVWEEMEHGFTCPVGQPHHLWLCVCRCWLVVSVVAVVFGAVCIGCMVDGVALCVTS